MNENAVICARRRRHGKLTHDCRRRNCGPNWSQGHTVVCVYSFEIRQQPRQFGLTSIDVGAIRRVSGGHSKRPNRHWLRLVIINDGLNFNAIRAKQTRFKAVWRAAFDDVDLRSSERPDQFFRRRHRSRHTTLRTFPTTSPIANGTVVERTIMLDESLHPVQLSNKQLLRQNATPLDVTTSCRERAAKGTTDSR